jgi:hypothetical protein
MRPGGKASNKDIDGFVITPLLPEGEGGKDNSIILIVCTCSGTCSYSTKTGAGPMALMLGHEWQHIYV